MRRSSSAALAAALVALAFAFCAHAAPRLRIAVIPFEPGSGTQARESFGIMLAEAARAALVGVGDMEVVDRLQLLDGIRDARVLDLAGTVREDALLQTGTLVGATHVLTGSYSFSGGRAQVPIRVVSVATRELLGGTVPARAPEADVLGLRDEVFCVVRARFSNEPDPACDLASSGLTRMLGAQEAWDEHFLALYRGRQQAALEKLTAALALDPSFAAARSQRDALFWNVSPGNAWVYEVSGVNVASSRLRREVESSRDLGRGAREVVIRYTYPSIVLQPFGECRVRIDETWVLGADGWAARASASQLQTCSGAARPLESRTTWDPPVPLLPIAAGAARAPVPRLRVRVRTSLARIADVVADFDCTYTLKAAPKLPTPLGRLDGVEVASTCTRQGQPRMTVHNAAKSAAFEQRVAAATSRASEGCTSAITELLWLAVTDNDRVEPEEVPVRYYGVLSLATRSEELTFVPGVGVTSLHEEQSSWSTEQTASNSTANLRLVGLEIQRYSPLSRVNPDPASAVEAPGAILGDTHVAQTSPFGGRPTTIELGLLGVLRPWHERLSLPIGGRRHLYSHSSHLVALGVSSWLVDFLRLGANVDVLGWGDTFDSGVQERFGSAYRLNPGMGFGANVRLRAAPRGALSIPQLEAGLEGHTLKAENRPPSKADEPVPETFDKGTFGQVLSTSSILARGHVGLLADVNVHDRLKLEIGWRVRRWFGTFGDGERPEPVDFYSHGAVAKACLGTAAREAEGSGIGICVRGWVDWPLGNTPGSGLVATGVAAESVLRFGAFRSDE